MNELPHPVGLGARTVKRFAWAWANFWLARSGCGFFGRVAARLAAVGYPPYKGRLELAWIQTKGYISASAEISHSNLAMGKNVFIGDRVIVYQHPGGGPVELGDRAILLNEIVVEILTGGSLRIGIDTAIQPGCHFTAAVAPIRIGNGVQIAPQCAFYSYDHGIAPGELIRNQPLRSKGPIIVEDDVWLGFGVIVLSGVRIGRGAVVGAGSIVTRDVPEGAIAVGSPARVINARDELTEFERARIQGAGR